MQTWASIATVIATGIALVTFMSKRFEQLEARIDKVDARHTDRIDKAETTLGDRIDKVETTLGDRIDKVETTLGDRIDKLDTTLGDRIEQVRQEAKADNEATRAEMRQRFGEVRDDLNDIRAGVRALEQRFFEILLPQRPAPTGTDDS